MGLGDDRRRCRWLKRLLRRRAIVDDSTTDKADGARET